MKINIHGSAEFNDEETLTHFKAEIQKTMEKYGIRGRIKYRGRVNF